MDIRLIKKAGVPSAEIQAHQQIHTTFNGSAFSQGWRGYASFKLARNGRGSGDDDFDLVLVTHTNVVVIELKNWHGKVLESIGGKWFVDGEYRAESPVEIANLKAKKLASVMKDRLGVGMTPFVNAFVVLQDGIEEMRLSADENQSVLYLEEFLGWVNQAEYNKFLPWKPKFNPLKHLSVYDKFFEGSTFKPKDYLIQGFRPGDKPLWVHPQKLYSEYRAQAKDDPDQLALLRQWDFGALGMELIGEGDRGFIGLREQRIYEYVAERNEELSLGMLRPIGRKDSNDVTLDFIELYALPAKLTRLTEFTNSILPKLSPDERVLLSKALLTRFSGLHDLNVAHRDISDHCLWVERPARIVMTGFPAAYYPSMKTVGALKDRVKVERSSLPEDIDDTPGSTPYRRDVFLLGAIVHLILFGERPAKVKDVYVWTSREADPYEKAFDSVIATALSRDPGVRYENARLMLEAMNNASASERHELLDMSRFEAFKALTRARDYEETEVFVDDDTMLFYRSHNSGSETSVKLWHGVEPSLLRQDLSIRLLSFFERARILKGCAISGIPEIVDVGLSRRSLLLVINWVQGVSLHDWLLLGPDRDARLSVAKALTNTVEQMHSLELSHGDIHPNNIIVQADGQPVFIDILDFRDSERDAYTTAYLPPEYKSMSPMQRDRYGLAAVLAEVFGSTQHNVEDKFFVPLVTTQLRKLVADRTASALEPLQRALTSSLHPIETVEDVVEVRVAQLFRMAFSDNATKDGEMRSDNGAFHVIANRSKKHEEAIFFQITGVGRQLNFEWDPIEERVNRLWVTDVPQMQLMRIQTVRDYSVKVRIKLMDDSQSNVDELIPFLIESEAFKRKFPTVSLTDTLANAALNELGEECASPIDRAIPVADIWQSLMDAEEDSLPSMSVAGPKRNNPDRRGQILVPYHLDSGVIDYDSSETVEVEQLGNDAKWRSCGYVNLAETTFGDLAELAVEDAHTKLSLKIGDRLRLRSTMEKASFTRRSAAVSRILGNKAVIQNLVQYFDATTAPDLTHTVYPAPTEADMAEYSEGGKQLNESQREAFAKVVSSGPVSLLQGPPGTGKTWFIATLLHYLMKKQQARRILLVSQSHEAVNNALEKSLELCRSKGLDFDAVRLGSESAASDAIRHLHSSSIEQSYRERFKAEKKERIVLLAREMGLPKPFVEQYVDLRYRLGGLAEKIEKLTVERDGLEESQEQNTLDERIRSLTETFAQICFDVYDVEVDKVTTDVIADLEQTLLEEYDIQSPDAVQRLRKLTRLSDDWLAALGSPTANFAEFLAKSRTVVAGTLVGIGHRASGVVQNLYDWVIIDEAGRAAPSELAVAMQAGHRILLVGDHHQLPPTFSQEVRDMVGKKYGSEHEEHVFESDFQRIFDSNYGRTVGARLLKQYRMAPDIGELVSDCFYEGKLASGRAAPPQYYDTLPPSLQHQVSWIDTSTLGEKGMEQVSDSGEQRWNDVEARVIMALLRQIVESDEFLATVRDELQPGEPAIGIICMYSRQREVLDRLKAEASWLGEARRLVKIDTVDSYQGKENRIIILSTVRNNKSQTPGFLRSPNRINVALSRAMERLFIVGATSMWKGANSELPLGRVLKKIEDFASNDRASILSGKELLR